MGLIAISSIFRLKKYEGHGEVGRVYIYDLNTGELKTNPVGVEPGYSLHRPLGKSHGARGITVFGGELVVAGSGNKFSCFDLSTYAKTREVDLDEVQYTHQLKTKGSSLYIVSTHNELLVRLEGWGKPLETHTDVVDFKELIEPHLVQGRETHEWRNDKAHFNSVGWDDEGSEYHVYLGANMLFNATERAVVAQGAPLDGPHDVLFLSNDIIVNSTLGRKTIAYDRKTLCPRIIFEVSEEDSPWKEDNAWGYTRGLLSDGEYLFIGVVPTKIARLRILSDGSYKYEGLITISTEEYEAIYDMCWVGPQGD